MFWSIADISCRPRGAAQLSSLAVFSKGQFSIQCSSHAFSSVEQSEDLLSP
jgi:hypothetical protein